jgi:peptidyl-prolyl cis-trans isomerase SurA
MFSSRIKIIYVAFLLPLVFLRIAGAQEIVDSVVASVDGEPITMAQLKNYASTLGETLPGEYAADNPAFSRALREMVLMELLEKESNALGVGVSSEEVEAYLAEIKRQNNVDDQGLEKLLSEKSMSLDDYRVQVKRDILRTRVLGKKLRSKIAISDEDIKRYLEEHPDRKPQLGALHIHQFIVAVSPEEKEDLASQKDKALSYLNVVKNRINDGLSWKELTKSNYLDLGFVKGSDLRAEFKKAIENLAVGKASDPIEIDNTFVVLLISSKVEDEELGSSFLDEMRSELFDVKYKAELDKFLNEELPKKYLVEFKI